MSDFEEQQKKKLINRYTSGNATDEEIQALFSLISADELGQLLQDDMDREISNIMQADAAPSTRRKRSYWAYAAAACITLVLSIGLYFSLGPESGENHNYVKGDVLPGTNKAVLTLADGRKINLDDASSAELANENGILIKKNSNGQLIYQVYDKEAGANQQVGVSYNTITIPAGGQYQVILPDGSKVWLNAASSLKYPSRFGDDERIVEMMGEAYFEIAKKFRASDDAEVSTPTLRVPFIVKAGNQMVEVLGTHFNINAYPEEKAVRTTLLEGSVRLSADGVVDNVLLRPGEQGILNNSGLHVAKVNAPDAAAWKDGDFVFENQDLKTTMRQIARWYNVQIVYDNAPERLMIGGNVSRSNNLSVVLQAIELTGKVKFKISGNVVTVSQ